MIKSSELRLGNIVGWRYCYNGDAQNPKYSIAKGIVSHIRKDIIGVKIHGGSIIKFHESSLAPLDINAARLKDWFKFFKHNDAWVLKEPSGTVWNFDFSLWSDFTYNTAELKPSCKAIHRLQNLYFELHDKELPYNENDVI